ncbi:CHC2-type zinc finger protein [Thermosporothrix hazakensis]|jgi:hypothetical protein|uniref:CHC2-type zinc finger protein n=1 Tax=Thermosporothrix hazakensis TaxID=644383 RepID=A0A326TSD3_THEHA|nr:CHC2 zinc finger domain-containing protein [Thermosporothrix hazakensis]PZW19320.1 CHC2-type zinc finger protein [Thermosporothrix hazakensis]GCE48241.1 hypothetical protein KTH_31100 [Thermosporothrix hazakensis]
MKEWVSAYMSLFVHCRDYYAFQLRDGSYRTVYAPLTEELVEKHLLGQVTLGTYVIDREGYCTFAVFDADDQQSSELLLHLWMELRQQGIEAIGELSRRGFHLWLFFEKPVLAIDVREWLLPYAQACGVELYPKQEHVAPTGIGSLIRLPLGIHQRSRGWYPFVLLNEQKQLVPVGATREENFWWVWSAVKRVTLVEYGAYRQTSQRLQLKQPKRQYIREWCLRQDIFEVIGWFVELDHRGVGRCPFVSHHYRGDVRPSFQVFGGDDPHWYCYTWKHAGNVFDFLRLYYGLTVKDAYQIFVKGEIAYGV